LKVTKEHANFIRTRNRKELVTVKIAAVPPSFSPSFARYKPLLIPVVAACALSSQMLQAAPQKSDVTLSPATVSFGSVTIGKSATLTVKLTNNQSKTLTISGILAGGGFNIAATTTCAATVAAAKSCNIDVQFAPTTIGSRSGTLTITDTAASSPQTVALSGSGVVNLTLSPTSLNFGNVQVGNLSSPQTVTLTNSSSLAIPINNISLTGDFVPRTNSCGSSVPAAASCALSISFQPTLSGSRTGALTFSDTATNSPQTASLSGAGVAPPLTLSSASLIFDRQMLGTTSASQTVTITNNSGAQIRNLSQTTSNPEFLTAWNCPTSLKSGASCSLTVRFAPPGTGERKGSLVITDTTSTAQTITFNGQGYTFTISVTPSNPSVAPGLTQQFAATGIYSDLGAQNLTNSVIWNSSLPSVASISPAGLATAAAFGYSTITATLGSVNGSTKLAVPAVISFTPTGNLGQARAFHTATLLNDGTLLVAGGLDSKGNVINISELYTPASGTFAYPGAMNTPRYAHTATLLNNGMVLVVGGMSSPNADYVAGAELYSPTGKMEFTPTGSMSVPRAYHTATLLADGKVLIAGGLNSNGYLASAELYDPSTGTFSPTYSLTNARAYQTATPLNNGTILLAGGLNANGPVAAAELFSAGSGFSPTGSMSTPRVFHTATALNDGTVLFAGGQSNGPGTYLDAAEVYNPATGAFTPTGSMGRARSFHTTVNILGYAFLAGGESADGVLSATEYYNPATAAFVPVSNMLNPREGHTATVLFDGVVHTILFVGGANNFPLPSAEIAHPEVYTYTP
jgi:hypothetical protein